MFDTSLKQRDTLGIVHQHHRRSSLRQSVLAGALLSSLAGAACAGEPAFPDRPVRLIVPFPPGGANDIAARVVGQQLNTIWGKPVIIDNRGGAGGNIATEIAARANPDGYTLLIGSASTLASNVGLYPKLPFDPRRDFAPISLLVTGPYVLVTNPSVPVATAQDLIKLAKAQPGKLNFSTFGEGSSVHLVTEMFKRVAGVQLTHVPYKGGNPALTAVIAGEVQMTFSNLSVALPQARTGKLKALAVTSVKRSQSLPGVPSLDESGLKGFDATAWVGILAPAGIQRALLLKLNRDMHTVVKDPEVSKRLEARGLDPLISTPDEFARHIRTEIDRWTRVIKEAGVKVEG